MHEGIQESKVKSKGLRQNPGIQKVIQKSARNPEIQVEIQKSKGIQKIHKGEIPKLGRNPEIRIEIQKSTWHLVNFEIS